MIKKKERKKKKKIISLPTTALREQSCTQLKAAMTQWYAIVILQIYIYTSILINRNYRILKSFKK